jgi:glutamyl-tRNA reductase
MSDVVTAGTPADLACLSVAGTRIPLPVFEALSFTQHELTDSLVDLQRRTGALQVCLLSTCERIELYAALPGGQDASVLVDALAANRGVASAVVDEVSTTLTGADAARHLLRVTAGLESFVLGERDITGQVRTSADASRAAGVTGLELERLLATAVHTSRLVHRDTRLGEEERSVAAAAVRMAAYSRGGDLHGLRLVVVGAGHVAAEVVADAGRLGARVTVCNRTRSRAERLAAAGATVVDLAQLPEVLATADIAIFGTASPQRLLEAEQLPSGGKDTGHGLLVLDLCVPRNVAPAVGRVPGVTLIDLADLRAAGAIDDGAVLHDLARAEEIVEGELARYLRWVAGRSAAVSVSRLRADVEAYAQTQVDQATRGVPDDLRPLVEERVRRAVHQLAHGPTKRLLKAAEEGDDRLVEVLAGLFSPPVRPA